MLNWLSFALAIAASIGGWLISTPRSTHWAVILFSIVPVVFAAIPLRWRKREVIKWSLVVLVVFTFNPLIFADQLLYVPATLAMLWAYIKSAKPQLS